MAAFSIRLHKYLFPRAFGSWCQGSDAASSSLHGAGALGPLSNHSIRLEAPKNKRRLADFCKCLITPLYPWLGNGVAKWLECPKSSDSESIQVADLKQALKKASKKLSSPSRLEAGQGRMRMPRPQSSQSRVYPRAASSDAFYIDMYTLY